MSGQHFAVRVDIDPLSGGLLEKLVQILQIVAGDDDERPLFNIRVDACGDRIAECPGICAVEQSHAFEVHLPELRDERKPIGHAVLLRKCGKTFIEPDAHFRVLLPETHGMMRVGGHALEAEKQRGTQRDNVCFSAPEPCGILITDVSAARPQSVLHARGKGADGGVVEVHVCKRGEQTVGKQLRDLARMLVLFPADLCQPDQTADEDVLQMRGFRLLAAHARADAAASACGLLTLKAKHF